MVYKLTSAALPELDPPADSLLSIGFFTGPVDAVQLSTL